MYNYSTKNLRKLSKDEVIQLAPSVITVDAHESLSQKYSPISTMDILDILDQDGWYPVNVEEVHARKSNTKGFQKHMIRFQHNSLLSTDENFEAVLTNSHDGKSRYNFFLGIYRLICSNGLMIGDTFNSINLKHVGLIQEMVVEASRKMIQFVPELAESIQDMKKIDLSPEERKIFAESSKMLLFPQIENKEEIPVSNYQILTPRRYSDSSKKDLWTTYNTVQENVIKGGLSFYNKETKKNQSTRKVRAINKNITLNRALWNLTSEMMKLKTAV